MPLQFFVVPVHDDGTAAADLNGFLASHKVLAVERQFVPVGGDSFWAICVDFWQTGGGSSRAGGGGSRVAGNQSRIDYKERLPPADFRVFLKLREWRKQTAQAEAVPVYAIFTNEQLAQVVSSKATCKADLAKIEGIGEARVAKYADALFAALEAITAHAPLSKGEDETAGKPVEPFG